MLTFVRRPSRRAFTLVELLITMVLLGLVGAVVVTVVVRQQRFYRATSALMDARAQIRQMASVLPMELRGISSAGGDIVAMTDSAIEFRSSFGSSVVCTNTSSTVIVLAFLLLVALILNSALSIVGNWMQSNLPGGLPPRRCCRFCRRPEW